MRALLKIFSLTVFCMTAAAATAADLEITITGVRSAKGQVRIAVFDSAAEFPEGDETADANVAARTGAVSAILPGLRPGRYAVAIHHDENGNNKMDTVIFGIPTEGYGFSNDARVVLGPPVFDAAAFAVPAAGAKITLRMQY